MNFTEFLQAADTAMNEVLSNAGFRHLAPGLWNRCSGLDLNVVHIQKQNATDFFCVNLGVHYGFLPKVGTEKLVEDDLLELADCEVKLRLTELAVDKDQWWPISYTSIAQVTTLMISRGLSIFDAYQMTGELSTLDAKSIERGIPGILASITKVRACLLLARLHEHLGNKGRCIEAATIGLQLAGMAVGPKKVLKDIIKRCAQ